MAGFDFADRYKAAGLSPGPEIIRLRQEPFDKLRKAMSPDRAICLVRLFFGLSEPSNNTNSWFRETFAEADPSFTTYDNAREFAVLSSCLLSAALQEQDQGHVEAGLAILTAAANNHRTPIVMPTLIEEARNHLDALSVEVRTPPPIAVSTIRQPAASSIAQENDEFTPEPDGPQAGTLLKQVSAEFQARLNILAEQSDAVLAPLTRQVALLQEEVNMLWWYVGGWSKTLDCPFPELTPPVAAIMAGIDLASMVHNAPGPIAARPLLHKLIGARRKGKPTTIMVKDAIDAIPDDALQQLAFSHSLNRFQDICPLLTALQKAAEIGKGTAWHQTFRRATGLTEDVAFTPLDLSMQIYREAMLLSCID